MEVVGVTCVGGSVAFAWEALDRYLSVKKPTIISLDEACKSWMPWKIVVARIEVKDSSSNKAWTKPLEEIFGDDVRTGVAARLRIGLGLDLSPLVKCPPIAYSHDVEFVGDTTFGYPDRIHASGGDIKVAYGDRWGQPFRAVHGPLNSKFEKMLGSLGLPPPSESETITDVRMTLVKPGDRICLLGTVRDNKLAPLMIGRNPTMMLAAHYKPGRWAASALALLFIGSYLWK